MPAPSESSAFSSKLELALEEAEAMAAQPQQPEPEAADTEVPPAETARPGTKQRRRLPPELPRRDVVHAPAGVCKAKCREPRATDFAL